jgi:CheY-specific phosphatase CheX
VLTFQRNARVPLGQALVHKGFLTAERLEQELEAFAEDQKMYGVEHRLDLPPEVQQPDLVEATVSLTSKLMLRLAGLPVKFGGYSMKPRVDHRSGVAVSLRFLGPSPCEVHLAVTHLLGEHLALGVLGFDPGALAHADVIDGVREFLNIVAGNVCGRMSERGLRYDITPTEVRTASVIEGRPALLVSEILTPGDALTLSFVEG